MRTTTTVVVMVMIKNICLHFRAGTSAENLINHQTNEMQQKTNNGNTHNSTEHNMHLSALTLVTA